MPNVFTFCVNRKKERIKNLHIPPSLKQKKWQELDQIPRFQEKGKGIPIGNMTSQVFAIIYLNGLDHYIKKQLHLSYYIRYMDDFVCLSTDKEKLKQAYASIEQKLRDDFHLELNPKTHIGMLKNGLDFLGYRFILKQNRLYLKVRTSTKRTFKKKMKKMSHLYREGKIDYKNLEAVCASYYGHLKVGNTYYLYRKVIEQYQLKDFHIKNIRD